MKTFLDLALYVGVFTMIANATLLCYDLITLYREKQKLAVEEA